MLEEFQRGVDREFSPAFGTNQGYSTNRKCLEVRTTMLLARVSTEGGSLFRDLPRVSEEASSRAHRELSTLKQESREILGRCGSRSSGFEKVPSHAKWHQKHPKDRSEASGASACPNMSRTSAVDQLRFTHVKRTSRSFSNETEPCTLNPQS